MESKVLNKRLGSYVIVASIAVTLFVSPWSSIDPMNLPKLSLLGVLAAVAASLSFSRISFLKANSTRIFNLILLLFVLYLVVTLFIGKQDFAFKFYGTPNRNTGFFAYLCLTIILFASAVSASKELLRKYSYALISVGGVLAIYGFAQSRGYDFFNYVKVYDSDVTGTFGNSNFQSAFMGMVAAVAMTWVLFSAIALKYKAGLLGISGLAIVNVALSSQQGYLNFVAGLVAALLVYLFTKRKYLFGWSVLGVSILGSGLLLLGILNKGPLAELIYKSSLQARGFYWRAALNMMVEHPLFGVGPDGFGDWYRRSRSQGAAEFNASIVADTAHSVPLDIGTSGGFPLLILYLAILGLALLAIIRVIKRSNEFDVVFATIVAAWVAYQAQSLISINQLGLGIWGWSLTGLLIGYELNSRNAVEVVPLKGGKKLIKVAEKLPASALLIAFVASGIGLAVSLPPYLAANKYYKALQSGDVKVIQSAAYLKPYDRNRFSYTVQILTQNKFEKEALLVLADVAKIYPDSFEIWQRWTQIPLATPTQIIKAKAEMKRLDPLNPDLK